MNLLVGLVLAPIPGLARAQPPHPVRGPIGLAHLVHRRRHRPAVVAGAV